MSFSESNLDAELKERICIPSAISFHTSSNNYLICMRGCCTMSRCTIVQICHEFAELSFIQISVAIIVVNSHFLLYEFLLGTHLTMSGILYYTYSIGLVPFSYIVFQVFPHLSERKSTWTHTSCTGAKL